MKKILCDINVLLDIFLKREPFYRTSAQVFYLVEHSEVQGYICALTFPILFYLLSKELTRNKSIFILEKIRALFTVAAVDEKVIDLALVSGFKDYEDAIQYYAAICNNVDYLITRNQRDYPKQDTPILSPEEFLALESM